MELKKKRKSSKITYFFSLSSWAAKAFWWSSSRNSVVPVSKILRNWWQVLSSSATISVLVVGRSGSFSSFPVHQLALPVVSVKLTVLWDPFLSAICSFGLVFRPPSKVHWKKMRYLNKKPPFYLYFELLCFPAWCCGITFATDTDDDNNSNSHFRFDSVYSEGT